MPRALGRYTLYARIGGGGMATVHLGRLAGPVGFGRIVAIKQMHRDYAHDADFAAMFIDEARLAARVHHPNVVQTLDVIAEGDELFLVMDYVRGASLSRLMMGGAVAPAIAAQIMCGALHGLHAAHEATSENGEPLDIVHRDVSPQNIIVGIDGIARLADFGIAKASGQVHTTQEGQIKGKFAYMAPEQITNVGVTRLADVFAASIVLWELLAGRRLFRAETAREVLARVMVGAIPPPSTYAPDVPPALDAIVLRGLERDLTKRFATAEDMAHALEGAIALATQSQVGEWVRATADEQVTANAELVAAIESGAHEAVDPATSPPAEQTLTELSSATPVTGRSRRVAVPLAFAVVLLGVASYVTVRSFTRPAAHATASSSPASTPPTSVEAREVATPESAVTASATALDEPRPQVARAAPRRTATPAASSAPSVVATPAPSSTVDCSTPSYKTPDGITHYKAECLHR